jgi:hypothetical protein
MREDMESKLARLLRFHRQNAFNESNGDAHCRAIARLKSTPTARRIYAKRAELAAHRAGQRLLATWN